MRGIFDYPQLVFLGERVEPVHVHRQAGEMYGHDGFRFRGDRLFRLFETDIARVEVDIDKHRPGTDAQYDVGGGGETQGWRNYLIVGADAAHLQRDFERAGGGSQRPHRPPAQIVRQRYLQREYLASGGDPPGAQHLGDSLNGFFVYGRAGEGQKFHYCSMPVTTGPAAQLRATMKTPMMIMPIPVSLIIVTVSPNRYQAAMALTT